MGTMKSVWEDIVPDEEDVYFDLAFNKISRDVDSVVTLYTVSNGFLDDPQSGYILDLEYMHKDWK